MKNTNEAIIEAVERALKQSGRNVPRLEPQTLTVHLEIQSGYDTDGEWRLLSTGRVDVVVNPDGSIVEVA